MATCPKGHTSVATDYCDECGVAMSPPATPAPSTSESPAAAAPSTVAPAAPSTGTGTVSWRVVATADRAYYDRMRAQAEPDAEPVAFPQFCPERRFALAGEQV